MAEPPDRSRRDLARVLRESAPYLGMGSTLAVTVGVAFAAGYALDGWLGTKPALSLVFGAGGVVAALVHFLRFASGSGPGGPRRPS